MKNRNNIETKRSNKYNVCRKKVRVDESFVEEITFKIADSRNELEQAYRLVYEVYQDKEYTGHESSGMRLTAYNSQPRTVVLIGIKKGQVIITLTLIPDSPFGLPMDDLYQKELDLLRKENRSIAEVGMLASHRDYRSANQTVMLFLTKSLFQYVDNYTGIDNLVMIVNPRHRLFYEGILLFEQIGDLKYCHHVQNNPGHAYSQDLRTYRARFLVLYSNCSLEKNIHHLFFIKKASNIIFPKNNQRPYIWNEEMLSYFFEKRTKIFQKLNRKHFNYIMHEHAHALGHTPLLAKGASK